MTDLPCKHPVVRVVSRHDDTEFVECQSCGEVFDSAEYADMELEERGLMDGGDTLPVPRQTVGIRSKGRRPPGSVRPA